MTGSVWLGADLSVTKGAGLDELLDAIAAGRGPFAGCESWKTSVA